MKPTTFNQFINEGAEHDFNHLELQAQINTLSQRKIIILRDEFEFPTIPCIDNMEDDELQRLHEVLSTFFFTTVADVVAEIETLDAEEIDDLGYYLSQEFLQYEPVGSSLDDDEDYEEFDKADVIQMAKILCKEYHFIGFLMGIIKNGIPEDIERLEEQVGRIMKQGNLNKIKRKFMSNTVSQLRREKAARTRAARANKAKKKRYYKANKVKISSYQKSRTTAIKKGKHKVKQRRNA